MAFTETEEAKLKEMLTAFETGVQISDLPESDLTHSDKFIEVYNSQNGQSEKLSLKQAVQVGGSPVCGRVWNLDNATPVAASYYGSLEFLRDLPNQLGLGCYLVKNDHSRKKLDAKDHYKLATGEPCKLDGSQGHYQWGWGRKFYIVVKNVGSLLYLMVSLNPIPGEKNYEIPVASMSAAGHACLNRETLTLESVVNRSELYRGGNNNQDWDGSYRSLLGMPATSISTTKFLEYARKNGDGWIGSSMRVHSVAAYLFYIIFGTFNVQSAFNEEKDENGLYQGGLGSGATSIPSWKDYNNYEPFIPTSAGIELGDACGVYTHNVMKEDESVHHAAPVPVFFGLKNMFGHLYRMCTDEQFAVNEDTTLTHLVAEKIFTPYSLGVTDGFKAYSKTPAQGNNYIKRASFHNLELMGTEFGGTSSTYLCDQLYNTSGLTSGFRAVFRGGYGFNSANAGLACVYGDSALSSATASYGSALCEAEEEWSVEPQMYEAL